MRETREKGESVSSPLECSLRSEEHRFLVERREIGEWCELGE